jgi:hypothetical protein
MATTKRHLSFFWGALDVDAESTSTPYYATTDYHTIGADATVGGGIGVRRATLVLDRSGYSTPDDAAEVHFDFLNLTGDEPDDTWTSADFSTIETLLSAWWNTVKGYTPATTKLSRIYWHRVGAGITKPNPAVRITDFATPVASAASTFTAPPQAACSISLRHGKRRSWGRTYLPLAVVGAGGRLASADADALVAATITLLNGTKSADFLGVVTSVVHGQAFVIDDVVVDTTVDIIRRRRFKHTTYIKKTAVT